MNPRTLLADDRAVSPVVGVALLIAITVILAAVIGGVVLGIGTNSAEAPQASLEFEYNDTSNNLTITHTGGNELSNDTVVVRGASDAYLGGDLAAGQSTTVNVKPNSNGEITVVWQDPNSDDSTVLGTYEA